MKRVLLSLLFAGIAVPAFAIGPLQTSGERQVAQLVSDGTVGAAVALDTWAAWHAKDRTRALVCEGVKDATVGAVGLLGQHYITSPRPDGTGNGMPSLHSMFAGATIASSDHWWANALLTAATEAGRYFGGRHTFKQVLVGGVLGAGLSFIRCGQ